MHVTPVLGRWNRQILGPCSSQPRQSGKFQVTWLKERQTILEEWHLRLTSDLHKHIWACTQCNSYRGDIFLNLTTITGNILSATLNTIQKEVEERKKTASIWPFDPFCTRTPTFTFFFLKTGSHCVSLSIPECIMWIRLAGTKDTHHHAWPPLWPVFMLPTW